MRPLNLLTSGDNASKKNEMVDWNKEFQQAFDNIKELCTNTPVLAFSDYSTPYEVHTDVNGLDLGTVLYLTHRDGSERKNNYASRTLNKCERKNPPTQIRILSFKVSSY